mgnify:CR=1 FL=1
MNFPRYVLYHTPNFFFIKTMKESNRIINGKRLIKHAPLRPYRHNELDTTVYIQSKTPFISAVKRIEKMLINFENIPNKRGNLIRRGNIDMNCNYITVKGMGKAISKVINIGMKFKFDEKFNVDFFTKSVGVLDEFVKEEEEEEEDDDSDLQKRNVGGVEIRIYVN